MYSYLKFASMRVHRKLCEVHGTHEFYSCRQNKKSLVYSVHPQSLKNFKHNFYVLVFRGKYSFIICLLSWVQFQKQCLPEVYLVQINCENLSTSRFPYRVTTSCQLKQAQPVSTLPLGPKWSYCLNFLSSSV